MFASNIFKSTQPTKGINSATPTEEWVTLLTEATIQFEDAAFQSTYEFSQASTLSSIDKDPSIVQEGVIDFTRAIIGAIKDFIKKIKTFFSKYKLYVLSYIGSFDKFLSRHSHDLNKLTPKEFTITGFEFTRPAHLPNMDTIYGVISDYNSELKNLDNTSIADLKKNKEEYSMENNGDWLRRMTMSWYSNVTAEEYPTEVFKFYRDGATEPKELTITDENFHGAVTRYHLNKKYIKKADELEKSTLKIFNTLEKFFKDMPTTRIDTNSKHIHTKSMSRNTDTNSIEFGEDTFLDYNDDNLSKVNLFYQYKWEQVRMLNPIISVAISGRIKAYKDELKQCAETIRKGILNAQLSSQTENKEGDK